ncbi:MAG: hypothetical protein A2W01_01005 [Candidatus Solincola sediminis]|nr:MAG: hypothetical protein A2W01_01005 [Candidatus Solincola sediminis]
MRGASLIVNIAGLRAASHDGFRTTSGRRPYYVIGTVRAVFEAVKAGIIHMAPRFMNTVAFERRCIGCSHAFIRKVRLNRDCFVTPFLATARVAKRLAWFIQDKEQAERGHKQ